MILEIQHETRLIYSEPAVESVAEVRMEPASYDGQSCHSFHLAVSPHVPVFRYADGFGNRVHHFSMLPAHSEITILAASVVDTHPHLRPLEGSAARWPFDLASGGLPLLDFLHLAGPVRHTPRLDPLLDRLRPSEGTNAGEWVAMACRYIHEHFEYAKSVTLASSPIDDVLSHGKGVCQDFTHLLLAILRSFRVPARYVSGYIHRPGEESQSHAWCEAWLPDLGWVGTDPTNGTLSDELFVKVAIGRDFTDCPPNKGLFRGRGNETIAVRVETRELEALPSLSWQEQLPPLQAPLHAIVTGRKALDLSDEDASQQQ